MAGVVGSGFKKKATGITYEQIIREVRSRNIRPIYYLMGDESYYIDKLADFIVDSILKPEERDFNLITFFGIDVDIDTVITAAKSYPMNASHLVIVVKEAQNLKRLDRLEFYFRQMQSSTVLIFCHKNGTLDRRTKVATLINKEGILFESKKLYDNQLPSFIQDYLKRKMVMIEPEACEMIADYIGSDLNRIASELDKLILSLPKRVRVITKDMVLTQIGISKNFNIFELQDAIVFHDVLKANRIIHYFEKNPKDNPIQMVLPSLFKFFSKLMISFYSPDKSEVGLASWLGISDWQVRKNIHPAMRVYTGVKVMKILSEIRRTDARSKGIGNKAISNEDLMKELIYFILH